MTFDEIKATLTGSLEEGADQAAAFDAVLGEVSALMDREAAGQAKIEELSAKIAELTDTNLKLLDKVRYIEQEEAPEEVEEEAPQVTIDNLFEEE